MPIATSSNTIRFISNIIKRFKFTELETAVMPNFPEVLWSQVKSDLVKKRKSFTATNVAREIEIVIENANLPEKVLQDRLSMLEVIDISLHDKRKTWYGYVLTGSGKTISHLTNKEIQTNIKDQFCMLNLKVDAKLVTVNGVTYVSIKEQKKAKAQRVMPIFFALFLGQKYFFCSKKNVSLDHLKTITNSMGYTNSKRLKLMGRDLRSLSTLYWKRKQGALDPENVDKVPVYKDAPPDIRSTGIDYTQSKQRRKFAEKCFGEDPPTLELLTINGPTQPWKSEDVSAKLPNSRVNIAWEFRSHNIATCLTKLIERRILVTPVPYYISNLMTLGKNELTLRND